MRRLQARPPACSAGCLLPGSLALRQSRLGPAGCRTGRQEARTATSWQSGRCRRRTGTPEALHRLAVRANSSTARCAGGRPRRRCWAAPRWPAWRAHPEQGLPRLQVRLQGVFTCLTLDFVLRVASTSMVLGCGRARPLRRHPHCLHSRMHARCMSHVTNAAVPAGDLAGGVHLLALAQEGRGDASLVCLAHMEPAHAGAGLLSLHRMDLER